MLLSIFALKNSPQYTTCVRPGAQAGWDFFNLDYASFGAVGHYVLTIKRAMFSGCRPEAFSNRIPKIQLASVNNSMTHDFSHL